MHWPAAAADSLDPVSLIQNFGFPMAFALMLLAGLIVTKREYDRMRADRDEERAARIALQKTLVDDVVPALTRSTDAVTRSTDLMESMARRQAGGG
jgi:Na+/phosphate symporter